MDKRYILNSTTGEIEYEMQPGDKIRTVTQDKFYQNKQKLIEMNIDKEFIKLYNKTMSSLGNENLSANEYKICFMLLDYIEYESGILKYSNNGKMLNNNDISDITGICRKGVTRAMQTLVSKGIYGVHKTGKENCYTVNPFIFMKGRYVNKTLYDFYKKSKWAKL